VSSEVTGSPLVITLSNGATITIPVGQTTGVSTPFAVANGEDVYLDAGSYTVSITGATGGNFEALTTTDTATVSVTDTIDTLAVSLSSNSPVSDGGMVEITASVTQPPQLSPILVKLSDDRVITIPVGQTAGSISYVAPAEGSYLVTIATVSGGNYENLVAGSGTTVTVADGPGPVVGGGGGAPAPAVSLVVNEAALDLSKSGADLVAGTKVGSNPNLTTETAQTELGNQLTFTAGSDAITSVSFGSTAGIVVNGKAADATYAWVVNNLGQLEGRIGTAAGAVAIVLAISGSTVAPAGGTVTPTITATLTDNFRHAAGTGDITISRLIVVARDSDGSTATGAVNVIVKDDVPQIVASQTQMAVLANQTGVSVTGKQPIIEGADNVNVTLNGTPSADLKYGGQPIKYHGSGATLIGYTGDTWPAGETKPTNVTEVFKVTLDPVSDTYKVELIKAVDTGVATETVTAGAVVTTGSSSSPLGYATIGTATQTLGVLTGATTSASFSRTAWYDGNGVATGITESTVNGSTSGWGVKNNEYDTGEIIRVDFDDLDYMGPSGFDGPSVAQAQLKFELSSANQKADIYYIVRYTDGEVEKSALTTITGANGTSTRVLSIGKAGKLIDHVQIYNQASQGSVKVAVESVKTVASVTTGGDGRFVLPLSVTATDGDGDIATGSLNVTFDSFSPVTGSTASEVIKGSGLIETISGMGGDDAFVFNGLTDAGDTITDFGAGDLLHFKASAFGVAVGAGTTSIFTSNATDAFAGAEKFHYNTGSGKLFYDADGTGSASQATLIATLENKYALSFGQLLFI
jgi:hypothetical protein